MPAGDDDFHAPQVGGRMVRGVKDAANGLGDRGALVQFGLVGLGVLLEMELAEALGHGGETSGQASRRPAWSALTMNSTPRRLRCLGALLEVAPMGLAVAESDVHADDLAFAVRADAYGDQDRAIQQLAVVAEVFAAGVHD